jgi:hypothetical protein
MVTRHAIDTLPLSGRCRLSRPMVLVLRCIGVILAVGGAGMLPYEVSAQPENFEIAADSNTASPGDAVKVSFRSLDPVARQITSCQASFTGNLPEECDSVDGEWGSVTLHVPENAEPGTMLISAGLTYYETQNESYRDATATIAVEISPPVESLSPDPEAFDIFAEPTRASPGNAVTVSFHSLEPDKRQITSCQAHFESNPPEMCDSVEDEWGSVTLTVPENAEPGTMLISAGLTYFERRTERSGNADASIAVEIFSPLEQPSDTPSPLPNTEGAQPGTTETAPQPGTTDTAFQPGTTDTAPPTVVTPPATVVPQDIPAGSPGSPPGILAILALLVILLAVIIALIRAYRRRNPPGHEQVQAKARFVQGPTFRIEETSKRPPWTIRLDLRRGNTKEKIEESRR